MHSVPKKSIPGHAPAFPALQQQLEVWKVPVLAFAYGSTEARVRLLMYTAHRGFHNVFF